MKINNKTIEIGSKPFLIAEMSGNHNKSLKKALDIVDAAAKSGADALKIQTFTPDTMTLNLREGEFVVQDKKKSWEGKSLYELYQEAYTPWDWHLPIKERCEANGMVFFSTPFDETSVDFLEDLGVELYKVASFECNDIKLIKKIAQTKKPMIISTGMASLSEIDEAVKTAKENGCKDLILLKCTSAYPSDPADANIQTIPHLRETFGVPSGLSDHTMGSAVAVAATALGAVVIEKHFCLSRKEGGIDSAFSMEPKEFEYLANDIFLAYKSLGKVNFELSKEELNSRKYRRSLYVSEDIKAGEKLTSKNIKAIRPGLGLPTKFYEELIGKEVKQDIKKGTPLKWSLI